MVKRTPHSAATSFAPATLANLGPGFDVLGLCFDSLGDTVRVEGKSRAHGMTLSVAGDGGILPTDPDQNTAGVGARRVLEEAGMVGSVGLHIDVTKGLPLGSGLGSSAASAVASIVATNRLLGDPLSRLELLRIAAECEAVACGVPHRDNVAPCLYGGLVLLPPESASPIPIAFPKSLLCVVVHPDVQIRTEDARRILPKSYPLPSVTDALGQLGGLVVGLQTEDWSLISSCLRDPLITPHRASLIPGFEEAMISIEDSGALGGGISGSGPTVFALARSRNVAERTLRGIQLVWSKMGISSTGWVQQVSPIGAFIVEETA